MSEHNEQATFFDWINRMLPTHPELHPLFFAVPNGANLAGDRRIKAMQMNKLKREGLVPGVSDTIFLSGRGGYLGLALEFKTIERKQERDGGLSESQQEFLVSAQMEGYMGAVAYGADEAVAIVTEYLIMPKTQSMIYAALKCLERGDNTQAMSILRDIVLRW
jgi:hypothetical protein